MTDPDPLRAWELLMHFHRRTVRVMDAGLQDRFGRPLDDYDVLHQLKIAGRPLRMTDLAQRLLVANSSCNRIVGRLERDGLIERSSGARDRREVWVGLTPDGRRVHRRMAAHHTRDIRTRFGDLLGPEDIDQLVVVFERLLAADARTDDARTDDGDTTP